MRGKDGKRGEGGGSLLSASSLVSCNIIVHIAIEILKQINSTDDINTFEGE